MTVRKRTKKNDPFAPTEEQIQGAFFDIVRAHEPVYRDLKFLFAVPNGGMRHIAVAVKLKRTGTRKGPLDVWFPVCRLNMHPGLAAEFKRPGEKMTKEQQEFADFLESQGWIVRTWTDAQQAWEDVKWYLKLGDE